MKTFGRAEHLEGRAIERISHIFSTLVSTFNQDVTPTIGLLCLLVVYRVGKIASELSIGVENITVYEMS